MRFDAVIAAAGSSERAGGNKLEFLLGADTVLERSLSPFLDNDRVENVIVVLPPDRQTDVPSSPKITTVTGGATRSESVLKGLAAAVSEGVLIHDGARPFPDSELINSVMDSVEKYGSGVPALPLSDSVRHVSNGRITGSAARDALFRVQTPQGFLLKNILSAYALTPGEEFADESERYLRFDPAGARIVPGNERNIKITTPGDYAALGVKLGIGYDIHRLVPFGKLMLAGVEVASDTGVLAHSDGDVAIHALIDALLSAAGESDIGTHFPDNDPRYDGIDSSVMLSETLEILRKKNLRPISARIVIRLQRPKLADHIQVMRLKIATLLGVDIVNVSIAAKTAEGLDSVGQGLAVAAECLTSVI